MKAKTIKVSSPAKDNWAVLQAETSQRAKKLGIRTEDDVEKFIDEIREGK